MKVERAAKRNEAIGDCGCKLTRTKDGLKIIDCPLHAAAPELLEACKYVLVNLTKTNAKAFVHEITHLQHVINNATR